MNTDDYILLSFMWPWVPLVIMLECGIATTALMMRAGNMMTGEEHDPN
jgi:hypothetical protein